MLQWSFSIPNPTNLALFSPIRYFLCYLIKSTNSWPFSPSPYKHFISSTLSSIYSGFSELSKLLNLLVMELLSTAPSHL